MCRTLVCCSFREFRATAATHTSAHRDVCCELEQRQRPNGDASLLRPIATDRIIFPRAANARGACALHSACQFGSREGGGGRLGGFFETGSGQIVSNVSQVVFWYLFDQGTEGNPVCNSAIDYGFVRCRYWFRQCPARVAQRRGWTVVDAFGGIHIFGGVCALSRLPSRLPVGNPSLSAFLFDRDPDVREGGVQCWTAVPSTHYLPMPFAGPECLLVGQCPWMLEVTMGGHCFLLFSW